MRIGENASPGWLFKALTCGGCAIVGFWVLSILLAALFTPLRMVAQSATCQSNVFRISRAFRLYADDYDDHLPPCSAWMDRTVFYVAQERYLHCPTVSRPGDNRFGYAMNGAVGGNDRAKIDRPEETIIVYDSIRLEKSASEPTPIFPHPGRHLTKSRKGSAPKPGNMAGYADGSARIRLDQQ
jgi:hypothetical protein